MEGARTLDGRREGTVPFTDLMMTSGPESVGPSDATLETPLDQQDVAAAVAVAVAVGTAAGMERDRTDATVLSTTMPAPSFQFNFTSERFKAAVQQAASSAEKDGSVEVHPVLDPITLSTNASPSSSSCSSSSSSTAADEKSMSSPEASVQKSASLVESEGGMSTVVQEFERCSIEEPTSMCTTDTPDIADTDAAVNQGRDATAAIVALRSTTTDHPVAPLLSQLGTMKDENDTPATAPITAAAADGAATAAAANLVGLLSMSSPPRSMSSLSITADLIQKSAPMSPMSFIMPKHKQRQAVHSRGQDLARANSVSTSRGSSVSVPTNPAVAEMDAQDNKEQ
ncbi:hypothetical protein BGZ67_005863 [Mortierella alpina]|nr:hypothetical protein BGZ67_005863 [Mortierella alpina]